MDQWSRYSQQNRRAWEEIAERRSETFPGSRPAAFFREGGSVLDPRVVAAMGEVAQKRLLHLMCATGEDTLSWAVLGAHAVGIDISERQIAIARQRAAEAGLSVRFEAADVGDLPAEFARHTFDCVYTGGGVLVWIPDLARWAAAIAAALTPAGRFVLWEEHPVTMGLWGVDGRVEIVGSYWQRGTPDESSGWTHFPGGEDATERKYEFAWPLGDVVTSLARAGLRIDELAEYPTMSDWRFGSALPVARQLPGTVLLVATREP
ncbi:MAG: class I SAM-dependent methyltransferase [Chloroflexi bacterium]|nr:class I SAM-dependent methyltransferase [Chloroflexota bacterium]